MEAQKTSIEKSHKWIKHIFLTLSGICILFEALMLYNYIYLKQNISSKIEHQIRLEGEAAARKINDKLLQTISIAKELAQSISTKQLNKPEIETKLKQELIKNPYIHGLGVAFEPFTFDKTTRLYAPYFFRKKKNNITYENIGQLYDYTSPKLESRSNWYRNAINKKPMWNEPYFAQTSQRVITEYTIPIYNTKDKIQSNPIGLVFINYDLSQLKNLVASLNFGKTGYGFLLSKTGTFISHPKDNYLKIQKTIQDLAKEKNHFELEKISKQILNGESGIVSTFDTMTQKECWLAYKPIPNTNWSLCYIYFKDEILAKYAPEFKKKEILLLINLIFLLLFLTILIAYKFHTKKRTLWLSALFISIVFAAGIATIWKLTFKINIFEDITSNVVIGNTDTKQFLTKYNYTKEQQVPLGIFVRHIEPQKTDSSILVGNLWLKFPKNAKANYLQKVVFPKSIATALVETTEAYKYTNEDDEIIGYNFKCNIPEEDSYKKFPFDYKIISLAIKPQDPISKIILTPDFNSYSLINPKSLPGVGQNIDVNGWEIKQSFYSYKKATSKTNFGLNKEIKKNPKLHFNIVLQRKILPPFISYILPLIVALFLLFIGLTLVTEKYFFTVLNATTGLFFTLVLAHISLRNALPIHEFFYLESFYIVSYIIVVSMILNLVMRFKIRKKFTLIRYKNNLIPKLLYWPIILLSLLLITAFTFY